MKPARFGLTLVILLFVVPGCAVNPVTGERELALIGADQEMAIGREQYVPAQQSQGGQYKVDESLDDYVSRVGQRIASVSDRDLPYEFVVLNNSTPNAWALPGGKIAVNRGLLTELDNEAELAAVLGHETVHAAARHGAKAMQRGMLLQGLVMATAISTSDSDYANYIVGGAQVGAQLLNQKYSRDDELEADHYGTIYMARAGYDAGAAVTLQKKFVEFSREHKSNWLEGLFSSHPPSQERVEANRETASRLQSGGRIGKDDYDKALAYLRSRQPAYDAFDEAQTLARKNKLEKALDKIQKAVAIEPKEPRFYGLKGDILLAQHRYRAAEQEYTAALQRDPVYYEYYLGRGLTRAQLGQAEGARADLQHSNELLPTAIASNELGKMSLDAGNRPAAKQYFKMAMNTPGKPGEQAQRNFIALDLSDNPNKYIAGKAAMSPDGRLFGVIQNRTHLELGSVDVAFEATANGQRIRRVVTTGALPAGQSLQVNSGWQFGENDAIEDAQISVVRARVR